MPALRELQDRFARALFDDGAGVPAAVAAAIAARPPFDACQRVDVYRNNVTLTLREALATTYPCVARLVGDAFFARLAREFARARPPSEPTLDLFGDGMPAFLEQYPPVSHLPYLPDVARLEWARIEVFRAAQAPALDFEGLSAVPAGEQPALSFVVSPAARLLCSRYPCLSIREYCLDNDGEGEAPALQAGGERVLVLRRGRGVELIRLGDAEHAFLQALAHGASLASAWEEAGRLQSGFDGGACLQRHVAAGSVTGWYRPRHGAPREAPNFPGG